MLAEATPRIELRGIHKHYGATHALDGLDLDVQGGEILGVVGPNGAGKSTLVRVLGGHERIDGGSLVWAGQPWNPIEGRRRVTVVPQEPELFPTLTVLENLCVGRERSTVWRPRGDARARELLRDLGIQHVAGRELARCSLAEQQFCALARALSQDAELFVFDEPNSALTAQESHRLFTFMRRLRAGGALVVLVTHRLGELEGLADRVAVVIDGRCATILAGDEVRQEPIARELTQVLEHGDHDAFRGGRGAGRRGRGDLLLRVSGLSHRGGAFHDVDTEVHAGQITALVGVEGSGARELLASLGGFEATTGTLTWRAAPGGATVPRVAYAPADRRSSLFGNLSVAANLVARFGRPEIARRLGFLRRVAIRALAGRLRERYLVKTAALDSSILSLSGGNQQKVALAAAIARQPTVILLEEPTRGVDITSKAEIYRLLRAYADDGHGVIALCTEVLEVYELADRALVLSGGEIAGQVDVGHYAHQGDLAAAIENVRGGAAGLSEQARAAAAEDGRR